MTHPSINIVSIKERIAINRDLTPVECAFVLDCINARGASVIATAELTRALREAQEHLAAAACALQLDSPIHAHLAPAFAIITRIIDEQLIEDPVLDRFEKIERRLAALEHWLNSFTVERKDDP